MKKLAGIGFTAALLLVLSTGIGMAQAPGGDQGGRGGRMGGRQFDPEQMRAMMAQRMQEQLGISEAEWKAIGPLIEAVQEKERAVRQYESRFGRFMGRAGRQGGNRQGPPGFEQPTAVVELQEVLADEAATSEQIQAKLQAFRAARKKAEAELKQAQEKLRQVLTVRQEAQLVLSGTLD
jgi:hypothetical protein